MLAMSVLISACACSKPPILWWAQQIDACHERAHLRLRPDVSVEQAQAEMSTLMASIDLLRPPKDRGFGAQVQPLFDSVTGGSRHALLLLMGAVGLLLLIACSNVAGLAMVRGSARIREMGVRTALGAGRARLLRQLLAESLFLGISGGTLGVLLRSEERRVGK